MTEPPPFDPHPVTLTGRHVRLEPLRVEHARDLAEAGRDPEVWRFNGGTAFADEAAARTWIGSALAEAGDTRQVPFAIIHRESDTAAGSTRYGDIRPAHRGLEIGWTWLGPAYQRTGVNTECKLLLLSHAFETLGAHRVQLKLDARNERSRRAVERIGATCEGRLRRHMVLPDGFVRDTLMFSITDLEWPDVRRHIESLMR